jgi:hypothetical protein
MIAEDYTPRVRKIRRELKSFMLSARQEGRYAVLRHDRLVVEGRSFTLEQLRSSPSSSAVVGWSGSGSKGSSRSSPIQAETSAGREGVRKRLEVAEQQRQQEEGSNNAAVEGEDEASIATGGHSGRQARIYPWLKRRGSRKPGIGASERRDRVSSE